MTVTPAAEPRPEAPDATDRGWQRPDRPGDSDSDGQRDAAARRARHHDSPQPLPAALRPEPSGPGASKSHWQAGGTLLDSVRRESARRTPGSRPVAGTREGRHGLSITATSVAQ